MLLIENLYEPRGIISTTIPLHPLRQSFLNPRRRAIRTADSQPHAGGFCFLCDKAVCQFVLQGTRQFSIHARQSLHRNTNPPIVQRARPCRCARDVHKCLLRVQNHSNRFRGRVVQRGFDRRKVHLQRAQYIPGQRWLGGAVVLQFEVAALVFLVAFFFFLVAERGLQRRLQFLVGTQGQGMLPLGNRLIELVHAVVRPACELPHIGIVRHKPPSVVQVIQRLLVFVPPQVDVRHVHQKRRLVRSVVHRRALIGKRVLQIAAGQFERGGGVMAQSGVESCG